MYLFECLDRRCAALQGAVVDPALDLNVGFRFKLEVTLLGVFAVVAFERALDLDWVRVVPFDEIAVISIH